ncbi:BC1872 family protein [Aneurinibacillus migulanus]|uniref:Phage ABA sandwich domain-containing protein n=1 Tax=Aneurinibacillus migulanus TaxID=47500 RepID=A0A0D1XEW5_ANEMI|nr:hypothetical protein [Aneurinibacillus migulanus]KIV52931.1 hypothetical protein TS65_22855 [Aneurinibacillus migulanus]KON95210.1 hypothetical protein AF333_06695 [Aneurinibacillus migulanus]MED0896713.1 hypothetical protein [Aneurinibacillus migulanus]MED1619505.1 hypothetical protein [Aneurinibacillus migulanus]SDK57161.1 hypothetical protein SAMN04487909_1748 [Aneurinibacillus migulanus]
MKAGRELDIVVAEKVMGWVVDGDIIENADFDEQGRCTFPSGDYLMNKETREPLPNYSTNIADAWEVVEQLNDTESYLDIKIQSCIDGWFVDYCNERTVAETAPHAICLAALKAVGWEGEGK